MSKNMFRCAATALAVLAATEAIGAGPISGVTYNYNPPLLANPDDGNGEWTWNFAGKDLAQTKLTDGVLGSLVRASGENVAFTNGTWAGYNLGDGGLGHPRVDLHLGGLRQVRSVEVQYLIENPPFIFAPQPADFNGDGAIDANAMTVFGSTDGTSFTSLGFTNAFEPIFGPSGSQALNTVDARTAVFDFGPAGTSASHIRVDVRTPFTWIFLGEITINEVPEPAAVTLGLTALGMVAARRRRRS